MRMFVEFYFVAREHASIFPRKFPKIHLAAMAFSQQVSEGFYSRVDVIISQLVINTEGHVAALVRSHMSG